MVVTTVCKCSRGFVNLHEFLILTLYFEKGIVLWCHHPQRTNSRQARSRWKTLRDGNSLGQAWFLIDFKLWNKLETIAILACSPSMHTLVCWFSCTVGSGLSALKKKRVFQILDGEFKWYYVKTSKSRTNLHLQKSNEISHSDYGEHRSTIRLNKSWLCGFITCCFLKLKDDALTLGLARWRRFDLLIVLLEGSFILTLNIKVTEIASCLKP